MKINLSKIPVMWTTCDKPTLIERNNGIQKMFTSLGLSAERVNGPITTPYTIGTAQGYLQMLKKYPAPFFSFEDDARACPGVIFNPELDVPDNADAVYLGTSIFGRIKKQSVPNGSICAEYDNQYLQVFNMLGFHSILYLNQDYVDACISYLEKWLENPVGGCDDPIAEKMHKHKVYCLRNPWFFQNDGHSDYATLTPITPIL